MEIVRSGQPGVKHTKTVRRDLRVQYRFDLRPCKLTCQFTGVILNEADSLLALNPEAIRADKYLLPILREEDYPYLADMLLSMEGIPKGALLDAEALVKGMGLKLFQGVFPENGVMGEIYFNFGMARIVDPDTGEIREAKIRPGTVLINRSACINRGMYNGTLLHEGSHFLLALKHFLLQMTHGHQYCSYLCKRRGDVYKRQFPAVCIRTSTERPEALDKGCFILAGIDEKSLLQAVDTAVTMNECGDHGIPCLFYTSTRLFTAQ